MQSYWSRERKHSMHIGIQWLWFHSSKVRQTDIVPAECGLLDMRCSTAEMHRIPKEELSSMGRWTDRAVGIMLPECMNRTHHARYLGTFKGKYSIFINWYLHNEVHWRIWCIDLAWEINRGQKGDEPLYSGFRSKWLGSKVRWSH